LLIILVSQREDWRDCPDISAPVEPEPEPIGQCHTENRIYDPDLGGCRPPDGVICPAVLTYGDGPCDEYLADRHERFVPGILEWELTQCDIKRCKS
jgi:hypothetical protein